MNPFLHSHLLSPSVCSKLFRTAPVKNILDMTKKQIFTTKVVTPVKNSWSRQKVLKIKLLNNFGLAEGQGKLRSALSFYRSKNILVRFKIVLG